MELQEEEERQRRDRDTRESDYIPSLNEVLLDRNWIFNGNTIDRQCYYYNTRHNCNSTVYCPG
jgi:hypothetical protein